MILHLGIVRSPATGDASFMRWASTTQELYVEGVTHPRYGQGDVPTWQVRVSGSWEVWGINDQEGHRSLHLEVEVTSLDPVELNEVVNVIQQWITGRILDLAFITPPDDHSRKTHVVDLSALPTVYVYDLEHLPF